jgi:hypothetical protein
MFQQFVALPFGARALHRSNALPAPSIKLRDIMDAHFISSYRV